VTLVDSAVTTAAAVEKLRDAKNLRHAGGPVSRQFLATVAPDRFARVGEIFYGAAIDPGDVELVDLQ
jgi:glutamate racemase